MKILRLFAIVITTFFVGVGCSTTNTSSPFSQKPIDYDWFQKQFELVKTLDEESRKNDLAFQEFIRRKGIGPHANPADQDEFSRLTRNTNTVREKLFSAVREYNARVQAEINVMFGSKKLPININMNYTATTIPVPETPQKVRGTNEL